MCGDFVIERLGCEVEGDKFEREGTEHEKIRMATRSKCLCKILNCICKLTILVHLYIFTFLKAT